MELARQSILIRELFEDYAGGMRDSQSIHGLAHQAAWVATMS